MGMYLILCGWTYIKSSDDNDHWKGVDAWYRDDGVKNFQNQYHSYHPYRHYVKIDEAYRMEKENIHK